jgi:hypothetical protein
MNNGTASIRRVNLVLGKEISSTEALIFKLDYSAFTEAFGTVHSVNEPKVSSK